YLRVLDGCNDFFRSLFTRAAQPPGAYCAPVLRTMGWGRPPKFVIVKFIMSGFDLESAKVGFRSNPLNFPLWLIANCYLLIAGTTMYANRKWRQHARGPCRSLVGCK